MPPIRDWLSGGMITEDIQGSETISGGQSRTASKSATQERQTIETLINEEAIAVCQILEKRKERMETANRPSVINNKVDK